MASRPSPCRSTLKPSPCRLPAVMTSIRIDSIAAGFHHGGALMHPSIRCRGAGKQSARNRELGPQVVPPSPAQSLQSRCHQRPRSRGLVLAHRRSSIGAADLAPQTPETPLCDDAVTNAAAGDKNVHTQRPRSCDDVGRTHVYCVAHRDKRGPACAALLAQPSQRSLRPLRHGVVTG